MHLIIILILTNGRETEQSLPKVNDLDCQLDHICSIH